MPTSLFAPSALLPGGWARDVLVEVDASGTITTVRADASADTAGAERLPGPALPGMANLHSHAFQRAIAGRTERRGPGLDSFWTWREAMYGFVTRVTPDDVQAIAAWLYAEMLVAGYTAVGEFHYLHHGPGGTPYAPVTEMSDRIVAAAGEAGLALTLLPVLYARGGFGGAAPAAGQARFVNDSDRFARLLGDIHAGHAARPGVRIGIAPHSLRAVTPEDLAAALDALDALDPGAPVHVHIAEQLREVDDCVAWSGQRPVEWLLDHAPVDARWCLVHATHVNDAEVEGMTASGCVVGLCPTTEANLGDGIFPAEAYADAGGAFGVGSDSHASVSAAAELRLLEYGQRLVHGRRAVLAGAELPSVGRFVYSRAAAGGAQALGQATGRIEPGARADLVVLDGEAPALEGAEGDTVLDTYVFSEARPLVREVWAGGRRVVANGRHVAEDRLRDEYVAAVRRVHGARDR